jgi:hypothetical protein
LERAAGGKWQALLWAAVLAPGCGQRQPSDDTLTSSRAARVQQEVRAFMRAVAHDVTGQGALAWGQHFAEGPSFFMVADGQLVFPNGAALKTAIPELIRALPHIELQWGEDIRVDALTPHLAVVATTYREVTMNAAGQRAESSGFFTGTAEERDGRWQFRNAHWSEPLGPRGVP